VRLETFLRQVIRLPCSYPPFFFQARPVTDIKVNPCHALAPCQSQALTMLLAWGWVNTWQLAVSATVGEGVAATGGKQGLVVRVTGVLSQPPSAKRTVTHVEACVTT